MNPQITVDVYAILDENTLCHSGDADNGLILEAMKRGMEIRQHPADFASHTNVESDNGPRACDVCWAHPTPECLVSDVGERDDWRDQEGYSGLLFYNQEAADEIWQNPQNISSMWLRDPD